MTRKPGTELSSRARAVEECLRVYRAETEKAGEKSLDLNRFVAHLTDTVAKQTALVELACLDLKRRWAVGDSIRVEDYLADHPLLGTPRTVSANLIEAEFEARRRAGSVVEPEELQQRFPGREEQISALCEQDASVSAVDPTSESTVATPPPKPRVDPRPPVIDPDEGTWPETFGRYQIVRQLGRGAMGIVLLAYDPELDRHVALKVPRKTDDPDVKARFLREARAVATIRHPHICPIYDVGEIDGQQYLTMAYIEGSSLRDAISTGAGLSSIDVAVLLAKLAGALAEAHKRGIIHRDLKPANIIVDADGEPVITDFGLARRLNADDGSLTQAGAILGTPAYMSPEQVDGCREDVGPRSDLYSLGVILYELLTGRRPFSGSPTSLLVQIALREPDSPLTYRPDLDPGIAEICMKLIAKNPDERYASAEQLADDLNRWIDDRRTTAVPDTHEGPVPATVAEPTVVISRSRWLRRSLLWGSGTAGLALLLLFVLWLEQPAEGPVNSPVGSTGTSPGAASPDPLPAPKLELYVQRKGTKDGDWFRLRQRPGQVPLHEGDRVQLAVTPESPAYAYLYWIDADGTLQRLFPEHSDHQEPITETLFSPPQSPNPEGEYQLWHELGVPAGPQCALAAISNKPLSPETLDDFEQTQVILAERAKNDRLTPLESQRNNRSTRFQEMATDDDGIIGDASGRRRAVWILPPKSGGQVVELRAFGPPRFLSADANARIHSPETASTDEWIGFRRMLRDRFSSYSALVFPLAEAP